MKKGSKKCAECNKAAKYECSCRVELCEDCSAEGSECPYEEHHWLQKIKNN